jgi:hypothetical protein
MHLCTTEVFAWRGVRSPSTTHATTSLRNFVNLLPLTPVTVDSINVKYSYLKFYGIGKSNSYNVVLHLYAAEFFAFWRV